MVCSRWARGGPGCPTGPQLPAKNSPAPIRAVRSPGEGAAARKKIANSNRIGFPGPVQSALRTRTAHQGQPRTRRPLPGGTQLRWGRGYFSQVVRARNPPREPALPPRRPPSPSASRYKNSPNKGEVTKTARQSRGYPHGASGGQGTESVHRGHFLQVG